MGTAKATKAADKSQVCRKLVQALQKLYGKSVPKIEMSVVETMLFAACLEDNSWATAETSLKKLLGTYFDLNEIRVSSVSELEQTLHPLRFAEWKGLRIRSVLRYIFETTYSYDFEKLRRQTLEQAVKTLKKVNDVTPFIRDFILHEILGSHIICLDNSMLSAALWLGLVPLKSDLHEASEFLKGGLKKSEVSEFCHLLRCLSTDPKFIPRFTDPSDSELTMDDVMDRFAELQLPPKKKPVKPVAPPEPPKVEKSAVVRKAASAVPETVPHTKNVANAKSAATVKAAVPSKAAAPAKPAASATPGKTTGSSVSKGSPSKAAAPKNVLPHAKPLAPKTNAKATPASAKSVSSKSAPVKPVDKKKVAPSAAKNTSKKPKK